VEKSGDYTKT